MKKQQYTIHSNVFLPAQAFPQYQFDAQGPQVRFLGDVNGSKGDNQMTNNIFVVNAQDADGIIVAIQKDRDWLATLDADDSENKRQIAFMDNLLNMSATPVYKKPVDRGLLTFLETEKSMNKVKPDTVLTLSGLSHYQEF